MTTEFGSKRWAYEPLVEWLNEGGKGRSWVHCDQLTLHRPTQCSFCDKYAATAQLARHQRGVPFSGELGAPDALFRPDATIKRWGGNRPASPTTTDFPNSVPTGYRLVPAPTPVCVGDGSQFCCVRNGCHPVCNCTVGQIEPKVVMAIDPHDQAADPPPYPTET